MKKISLCVFVLTIVLTVSNIQTFAQPGGSASTAVQVPDVFGYFIIHGKAPRGFADIDHLNLAGSGESGAEAKPPFYGQIRPTNKAGTGYNLLKPTIEGKHISFKTKAVKGISYEFDGTLNRTDFGGEMQLAADEIVLTGTLKKLKAGKLIAQSKLAFNSELGD